jgi:hypothetical protein
VLFVVVYRSLSLLLVLLSIINVVVVDVSGVVVVSVSWHSWCSCCCRCCSLLFIVPCRCCCLLWSIADDVVVGFVVVVVAVVLPSSLYPSLYHPFTSSGLALRTTQILVVVWVVSFCHPIFVCLSLSLSASLCACPPRPTFCCGGCSSC